MENNHENKKIYALPVVNTTLVWDKELYSTEPINSPEKALELLGSHILNLTREVLCIICLNTHLYPINVSIVMTGTISTVDAPLREIMQIALLSNANSIMMVHNHPAMKTTKEIASQGIASKGDIVVSNRLFKACDLMGINMVDSVIIGREIDPKTNKIEPFIHSIKKESRIKFHKATVWSEFQRNLRQAKDDKKMEDKFLIGKEGVFDDFWEMNVKENREMPCKSYVAYSPDEFDEYVNEINDGEER